MQSRNLTEVNLEDGNDPVQITDVEADRLVESGLFYDETVRMILRYGRVTVAEAKAELKRQEIL